MFGNNSKDNMAKNRPCKIQCNWGEQCRKEKKFWYFLLNLNLKNQTLKTRVSVIFNKIWIIIFEPLLFTSIGNEILFSNLDTKSLGLGIVSLLIGITVRFAATFLASIGENLNIKEKIFICISWLPKATVQVCNYNFATSISNIKAKLIFFWMIVGCSWFYCIRYG